MPHIGRIAEIDCLRGIAILMMVIFHIVFDLAYFFNWPLDYLSGFWYYQGKSSAILFMLISGISATLGRHPLRRGLKVLGAGMLITLATYVYSPALYIRFGILHLLGVGMLAAPWLVKRSALTLTLAGTTLLVLGNWIANLRATIVWLIPLGVRPWDFASIDYYPLLPWLGIVLYGMAAGKLFYSAKQPLWPAATRNQPVRILGWLGRRSLIIYLLHQPILLVVLSFFMFIR
ncbi:heparan-alpha-glucosaminide N-acetyltransferase [Sporomusa acidovorans]|uniref:heparan-alpha-glucosaminide N-acetyltransferase n=1 Tax=Sporomusa acidovorans TaxID=112900 RepID=UPI0011601813|nr:heparan-alpha-glucosaminide N-acetyltransferase [Sporomusa acidovorans]